jgi:hypothetical protein
MHLSMGIDIYAEWDGMSQDDEAAQVTGFSVEHGQVGYLREAYHGGPYATRLLVPEAFEEGEAEIPAALLRERLRAVLEAAEQREKVVYGETDPLEVKRVLDSFRDFVALCERKERETGKPCRIIASY